MDHIAIGRTLDVFGKVLVAYTAIMVHIRFRKERKIDNSVFGEMRKEQRLGIIGIVLIVAGYLFEVVPSFL